MLIHIHSQVNLSEFPEDTDHADTDTSRETTLRATLADINYLARSQNRFRLLETICTSSCRREDLRRRFEIHRTTLRKNLRELEDRDWIESSPSDNTYRGSPAGRIVVESLRDTLSDFRTADQLEKILPFLPENPSIRTLTLRACNVTRCDVDGPYAPMHRLFTLVEETESLHSFTPVFTPLYVEGFADQSPDAHEFEIIGPPEFFDTMRSEYGSSLDQALGAASVTLLVSNDLPQFGVFLFDDAGVIAAYDHNMRLHSLLEAGPEQQQVIEWAEQQYETQRNTADEYESWRVAEVTPQ